MIHLPGVDRKTVPRSPTMLNGLKRVEHLTKVTRNFRDIGQAFHQKFSKPPFSESYIAIVLKSGS